jgi:hypothetical protein
VLILRTPTGGGDQRAFSFGSFDIFSLPDLDRSIIICMTHLTELVTDLPPSPCLRALRSLHTAQHPQRTRRKLVNYKLTKNRNLMYTHYYHLYRNVNYIHINYKSHVQNCLSTSKQSNTHLSSILQRIQKTVEWQIALSTVSSKKTTWVRL